MTHRIHVLHPVEGRMMLLGLLVIQRWAAHARRAGLIGESVDGAAGS